MNLKNLLLLLSFSVYSIFFLYREKARGGFCEDGQFILCNYQMAQLENVFNTFAILFILICFIYFFPKKYFNSWWKFARIAFPSLLAAVAIINLQLHHTPGGWMNLDHNIDSALVLLLQSLFVVGSLVTVYFSYHRR